MTYSFKIPQALHQQRFDHTAHALLNESIAGGISKAQVRKLVMVGACYLNGKRCRIASKPVWAGNELRVEYNPQKMPTLAAPQEPFDANRILFNEHGIIVVDKPAGLPTVATLDNARDNLVAQLEKIFPYVGVHHRLDAPTSGLILFIVKEEMNGYAARLFQESLIQKQYLAVVSVINPPAEKKWEIKNQLGRIEKKKNIYGSISGEGSFAHSRFEILEMRGNLALVRAEPVTGRTHQLRVHLSEYGLPIVGDRTYGSTRGARLPAGTDAIDAGSGGRDALKRVSTESTRLMLHAHKLTFRHPVENREVVVEAPLPAEFKNWNL
ncbi:MAG: RluA family pseudouridine synthase [Spirochaetes bacterium]|nr:RluA family pseudouridine synthase [Spirochaetota bacterium]